MGTADKPTYYLDPLIRTEDLYEAVLAKNARQNDLEILSRNFVGQKRRLMSLSRNSPGKYSTGITYDKNNKTFYSLVPGYVWYREESINLLPFFHIDENHLECLAVVPNQKFCKEILSFAVIHNFASVLNLDPPMSDEKIHRILEICNHKGGLVPVSQGVPPKNGRRRFFELTYQIKNQPGKKDESGNIDYKERDHIPNVKVDDMIAQSHPAIEAKPGRDIYGKPIPPKEEAVFSYELGPGVSFDQKNNVARAEREGILAIVKKKVLTVSDCQIIYGNVDLSTGNLKANGNLFIRGDICNGMTVHAKGYIQVNGNIENAKIHCDGHLVVRRGVLGGKNTFIQSGDYCDIKFIRNAVLQCDGDLFVRESIMNSEVSSKGRVIVNHERRGKIIGGITTGKKGIDVAYAGNINGLKTILVTGEDVNIEDEVKKLKKEKEEIEVIIAKMKVSLGKKYFENPSETMKTLNTEKRSIVEKIAGQLTQYLANHKKIKQIIANLEDRITRSYQKQVVIIHQQSFEGVTVVIGKGRLNLNHLVPSPTKYVFDLQDKKILSKAIKEDEKQEAPPVIF